MTTVACCSTFRPRTVMRPGSPGPAPTRYTGEDVTLCPQAEPEDLRSWPPGGRPGASAETPDRPVPSANALHRIVRASPRAWPVYPLPPSLNRRDVVRTPFPTPPG